MIRELSSIHQVDPSAWNALVPNRYPFVQHGFLSALEDSGATSADTGWVTKHLVYEQNGALVAALPLFEKYHSRGEYVFDFSWADAFERAGGEYYPKLLTAAPFTPATGPRYLGDPAHAGLFQAHLDELLTRYSSWHGLFPNDNDPIDGDIRDGVQYHWHNQDYADFDAFLATMTSKRRKAIKRERRIVRDQGIQIRRVPGDQTTAEERAYFYHFYQHTYQVRGQMGYLNERSFEWLFERLGSQMNLVIAESADEPVGMALLFLDDRTLYGRYWGGHPIDCLHFEVCYYQGIELAIELGLKRFDPGAQGEHKIPRGFEPVKTHSRHQIAHPEFANAVRRYLSQESLAVDDWQARAAQALPFKS